MNEDSRFSVKGSYKIRKGLMANLPVRLKKDPIIEAIFEIRFQGKVEFVSDVLPGLIFSEVREDYSKMENTPIKQLPNELLRGDPNLKYKPYHRLIGENYVAQIGEHVFTLSCKKPYPGWQEFSKNIEKFLKILQKTDLIDKIERFSLKYINLLQNNLENNLDMLETELWLGPYNLTKFPTQIRTECPRDEFINIIQIVSDASVVLSNNETLDGLLLDIDTISRTRLTKFWDNALKYLKLCHDTEKKIFFEMLKKDTVQQFDPVWG